MRCNPSSNPDIGSISVAGTLLLISPTRLAGAAIRSAGKNAWRATPTYFHLLFRIVLSRSSRRMNCRATYKRTTAKRSAVFEKRSLCARLFTVLLARSRKTKSLLRMICASSMIASGKLSCTGNWSVPRAPIVGSGGRKQRSTHWTAPSGQSPNRPRICLLPTNWQKCAGAKPRIVGGSSSTTVGTVAGAGAT